MPNKMRALVTHVGTIHLSKGLILENVLFVPSFKFNLVSVSRLNANKRNFLAFSDKYCLIQDLLTWTMIGHAKVTNGLYIMQRYLSAQIPADFKNAFTRQFNNSTNFSCVFPCANLSSDFSLYSKKSLFKCL